MHTQAAVEVRLDLCVEPPPVQGELYSLHMDMLSVLEVSPDSID